MTDTQPAALADHTERHLDMVGRWYMVNRDGTATLCVDREDAEAEARKADREWPRNGPHRAVQLVEVGSASLSANAGEPWTGGEEWEALAWHLCAEENGEDACGELLWEGGPIPEPWGDRWMKYESDAKRMIELVRKFVAAQPTAQAEGWRLVPVEPTQEMIDAMRSSVWLPACYRAMLAAAPTTQPAPQQEPVAWYVTGCGRLLDEDEAKAEARRIGGTARAIPLYTAPQPSPPARGDALSDDAVRVPLDSLHADAAYLIGRLREGSMPYARVIEIIRERIDAAKAAIRARAPADSVLEDAARYRFLRDGDWREHDKLESIIRLQLNKLWDAAIDAALAAQGVSDV